MRSDRGSRARDERTSARGSGSRAREIPAGPVAVNQNPRAAVGLPLAIAVALACAAYANSLLNGFVYDDIDQVVKNPWIRDFRHLPEILARPVWGFKGSGPTNYYRPAMHVSYMATYHLFGLRPWGFHLVNVALHAAVTALVFLLASRLCAIGSVGATTRPGGRWLAPPFVAAVLFAAHPIHTEAVTWIAGVPDLSFALLYLLALHASLRPDGKFRPDAPLPVLAFAAGLLCKETALSLPLLLIVWDLAAIGEWPGAARFIRRYAPYLAVSAAYLAVRFWVLGGLGPQQRHASLSAWQYFVNVFPLFADYLRKLVLPVHLTAFHVFRPELSALSPRVLGAVAVTVGYLAALWIARRRSAVAYAGMSLLLIPLLPVFYIPGLGLNTFAERYLYLPSAGFALLTALGLRRIAATRNGILVVSVALPALLAAYMGGTIARNRVWSTNDRLFSDIVAKNPEAGILREAYGYLLVDEGRVDEGLEQYRIALTLMPAEAKTLVNIGVAYTKKRMPDAAIDYFRRALEREPDQAETYDNIGVALLGKGDVDAAIDAHRNAVRLKPSSAKLHFDLGLAYHRKGAADAAVAEYEATLALEPEFEAAHTNLAALHGQRGGWSEAIEHFSAAARLNPDSADTHHNLGMAYLQAGEPSRAVEHLAAAVRLNPNDRILQARLDQARQAARSRR